MTVRSVTHSDIPSLGVIAEAAGLFPAEYLPEMIQPSFDGGEDRWLVADRAGAPAGFAFARPEAMTDRVWNILALGVAPEARREGLAKALLKAMEATLDARLIIIETTQLPEQAAARAIYAGAGYEEEGRIRDFFADGEDKVIFRKVLS
ncbi:MAG: GNAT family N-acetyltransferase [Rhodobacter sp.]|nr:GNAT family N-acetyltransferase [Rhodobacter sp.]